MARSDAPLALTVSTAALRYDAKRRVFRGRLSEIAPDYGAFHQVHYRGFGLRSARTGTVLPFYIDRDHTSGKRVGGNISGPTAYTLLPTEMALDACPAIAGVRIVLTADI